MSNDEFCCLDHKSEKTLTNGGYVYIRDIVSTQDKHRFYNSFRMPELRNFAKEKGLPVAGRKAELVNRMVESGLEFGFPQAYLPGPKLYEWLETIAEGYITEIRKNAKRFHPLYHEYIWLAVDHSGLSVVDEKVKNVLASKYWLSMFTI